MKNIILILFGSFFFTGILYGQEKSMKDIPKNIIQCLDKTGQDSSAELNICESTFLNYFFENQRGSFSFEGKNVLFLTGNYGANKSTKNTFFSEIKQGLNIGSMPSHAMRQLLILDESDRKNTGYDAAIITGSKKYLTKKDVIKPIGKFRKR
ncbi:hypothetical protein ACS126_03690 [Sphingobacterium lactis]|uniref:hypothetical protein n=1 Tax=Sphingobacterium TaxID=28453 RepID=UPI0021A84669|nr:hypothetical protein [Sphingobacterium hotanense]MCT1526050.1 hypothetical protein [Sphingobacterium hotanense]